MNTNIIFLIAALFVMAIALGCQKKEKPASRKRIQPVAANERAMRVAAHTVKPAGPHHRDPFDKTLAKSNTSRSRPGDETPPTVSLTDAGKDINDLAAGALSLRAKLLNVRFENHDPTRTKQENHHDQP